MLQERQDVEEFMNEPVKWAEARSVSVLRPLNFFGSATEEFYFGTPKDLKLDAGSYWIYVVPRDLDEEEWLRRQPLVNAVSLCSPYLAINRLTGLYPGVKSVLMRAFVDTGEARVAGLWPN